MTVAAWAQASDVMTATGATVTDAQIVQAQAVIELRVGRTFATTLANDGVTSKLRASALHWLSMAVAYQAAWMAAQPDLFTRSDIEGISQDGVVATFRGADGLTLAPLAKRALKRLKWRGPRSVQVESYFERGSFGLGSNLSGAAAVYDYPGELWVSED